MELGSITPLPFPQGPAFNTVALGQPNELTYAGLWMTLISLSTSLLVHVSSNRVMSNL